MVLTGVLFFVFLVIPGAVVKYGKQYWLIAGYNTMPKEKKDNVDVVGLANFMAKSFFGIGVFALAGSLIASRWCPDLFPAVIMICTGGIFLMVFGAQKFDKNKRSKKDKLILIALLALAVLVLGSVGAMLIYGSHSPGVEATPEGIVISGIYGAAIPVEEITGIDLKNEIPKIRSKNNGFDSGEVRKGHFTLDEMGRGRLYLESNRAPFVCIFTKDSYVIINYKDPIRTEVLYRNLIDAWSDLP